MEGPTSREPETVLETDRLLLRPWRVSEAAVQREMRRAWGQGYATEAARAVLEWAHESGYRRLWATVRAWNVASLGVLAKLGFAETGRVERDEVHGDSLFLAKQL